MLSNTGEQNWAKKKIERILKWPPKMAAKISRFFNVDQFQRKLICWLFCGWRTSCSHRKYSGVTFVIACNCNSSYVTPDESGDMLLFYVSSDYYSYYSSIWRPHDYSKITEPNLMKLGNHLGHHLKFLEEAF